MILRQMTIAECWCTKCGAGQMEQIYQKSFEEKKQISEYAGEWIKCAKCGEVNTVEDIVTILPTGFLVSSANERSKIKSNEELGKWLNCQNDNL